MAKSTPKPATRTNTAPLTQAEVRKLPAGLQAHLVKKRAKGK